MRHPTQYLQHDSPLRLLRLYRSSSTAREIPAIPPSVTLGRKSGCCRLSLLVSIAIMTLVIFFYFCNQCPDVGVDNINNPILQMGNFQARASSCSPRLLIWTSSSYTSWTHCTEGASMACIHLRRSDTNAAWGMNRPPPRPDTFFIVVAISSLESLRVLQQPRQLRL